MRFNSPAPFKSGKLVLGKYRKLDLIILAAGIISTFFFMYVYLSALEGRSAVVIVLLALPAGIGYMLIQPYGIYHNWLEYLHVLFLFNHTRKVWVSAGEYQNTGGSSIDEEVKP